MNKFSRIIAGVLAVTVSAGTTASIAYAKNNKTENSVSGDKEKTVSDSKRVSTENSTFKDETVYVLCNNDSSVKDVIVSDWLKNSQALDSVADVSGLSDITNVKGDEGFIQSGDSLDWYADGNDIYYKGKSDKELPVDVNIEYFLDGKKTTLENLTGKSGHVKIRWNYKNNQKITRKVNGKNKTMYVPFMTASVAMLDSGKFLNVETVNGKVISDGEKLVVIGVAFPALSESLGLDGTDIELPESFEISADVTDFEMNSSMTFVTNEIFSGLDIENTDSLDDLKDKISELSDGAEKLCTGTAELYDGICKLSDGTGNLTDGIDKLLDGSFSLKSGVVELSNGSQALADGAKTLSDSVGTLSDGVKSAKDGSAQILDGVSQVNSGADSLTDGISQLNDSAEILSGGINSAKSGAEELVSGFDKVTDGTEELISGAEKLTGGVDSLKNGSLQVKNGSLQVSAGMDNLTAGAGILNDSAEHLSGGINSVRDGADELKTGISSAKSGIDSISVGAENLSAGITTAGNSLETTISANEQALTVLTELYQKTPSEELAIAVGTLQQTIEAQKQISSTMTDGGQLITGAEALYEGTQKLSAG
ncbi:MAG: hypothetical protein K2H28_09885, partial [Ruminococcus sp.]|nr:hypothetical protein [Ruminococcus sp.]